jgi:uncharacterized protein YbaP (TraB family)
MDREFPGRPMRSRALLRRLVSFASAAACMLAAAVAAAPASASKEAAAEVATEAATACPPLPAPPTPAMLQAGQREARDRGFLWRLDKGGRSSYLYGTVHVARFEWMFPGPQTQQALNGSDVIALELDLLDPALQRRMADAIAARRGAPLPAPLAQRLKRQAQAECVPIESLDGMGPMLQISTLSALVGRRDGLDPAYGIDLFIAAFAHGAHKRTVSLETPELQLDMLGGDAETPLEAMVESGLDELESGRARPMMSKLVRIWADGNDAELARYEEWCQCVNTPVDRRAMRRLLDDRNPALAAGIDALHTSGKQVFAAVGSLHMIGPRGLPALLAGLGYRVVRIEPQPRNPP